MGKNGRKKKAKRFLAIVLAILMVNSVIDFSGFTTVHAAEIAETSETEDTVSKAEIVEIAEAEDTVSEGEIVEIAEAEDTVSEGEIAEDTVSEDVTASTPDTVEDIADIGIMLYSSTVSSTSAYQKPEGEGTKDEPYRIANAGNLYWFAAKVNGTEADGTQNTAACAELTGNITVNEGVLNNGTLNGDGSGFTAWTPIGKFNYRYTGTFDGKGYTISGLYFNDTSDDRVGLFGVNGGTIQNVTVSGSYFNASSYVGGICGYNTGIITNSTNSGSVSGSEDSVGGICGDNYGTITNSTNSGSVSGSSYYVGGICGFNEEGSITTNCYFDSKIYSGEAVGENYGTVENTKGKTTEEFASGEVAYLLNGSKSDGELVWYQNLDNGKDTDTYPVLDSSHGKVYKVIASYNYDNNGFAVEAASYTYSNSSKNACNYQKPEGEGTKGSPYRIANAGNLYWFAAKVNGTEAEGTQNKAAWAILTDNITVNKNVLNKDGTLSGDGSGFTAWTPIGNYKNPYTGTFDGQGYTISGLYFNNTSNNTSGDRVGLFGFSENGTIQNVTVYDSYFNAIYNVGGICGFNKGSITNSTNSGSVRGTKNFGGICGYNDGTITNSTNSGSVSGSDIVGGICGDNDGTITNSTNSGRVSGSKYVGGICGNSNGTITNCYFDSSIYSGAAVEFSNGGTVENTEGKTTAEFMSGEVAYLLNGSKSDGELVWYQNLDNDSTADTYPVLDSSHGKVYRIDLYNDNGFAGDAALHTYSNTESNTYKYQKPEGEGTKGSPYKIANAGNLYWFAAKVNGTEADGTQNKAAWAVLTGNITVNKNVLTEDGTLNDNGTGFTAWTPIGNYYNRYTGTFDGKGYTISGLYFNDTSVESVGLFGYIEGTIQSVTVSDSYFNARSDVGGICGFNNGTITNSTNSGSVSGRIDSVGGICGFNNRTITNSTNSGSVSGRDSVGGICGHNTETITNCYFDSSIYTGNAVGKNLYGTVEKTEGKTTAEFKSGEVAYLLNGSKSDGDLAWYQNLDNGSTADTYPVLDSSHGIVYKVIASYNYDNGYAVETASYTYSNSSKNACNYQKPEGEGTEGSPYRIANAGNLYWFAAKVNGTEADGTQNKAAWAVLTGNITVNKNVLTEDGTLNDNGTGFTVWTPIGNYDNRYIGTFDGKGYTISGLYFNDTSVGFVGLFGSIEGATIQNVTVSDSYFNARYYVGGICGYIVDGTITNSTNSGSISGMESVGGICGYSDAGSITNSTNSGSISGKNYVGGICGYIVDGTITNSTNSGSISGKNYVGGICGYIVDGTITNSTNSGSISGMESVGGICGYIVFGSITNSANSRSVSGTSNVGGICGYNRDGTIANCYFDSSIYTGNAVGYNKGGSVENTEGKTTAEFRSGEVAYLLNGSTSDGDLAWYQNLDNGSTADTYPVLDSSHGKVYKSAGNYDSNGFSTELTYSNKNAYKYQKPEGEGTEESPYKIANAGNLYWFAAKVNGTEADGTQNKAAWAVLTGNITVNVNVLAEDGTLNGDGSGFTAWTPIGNNANRYTGTFDGKGYTISGLYINDTNANNVGLFGLIYDATIQNVTVSDSYFNASYTVGGICGYSWFGTITNSTNSGSVSGTDTVGGICGYNFGRITNSTNSGSVSGSDVVGGICGNNAGTITNSTNSGSVSGMYDVGGICGFNSSGTITNSINSGSVSGSDVVGGICGFNSSGTITNSTNSGSVSGTDIVGGICGNNAGTITNCYFDSSFYYGDAVGYNDGTVENTEGKTTAEFRSGEVAYLLNGSTSDGDLAWYQNLDNGSTADTYPVLDSSHGKVYYDGEGYTNSDPSVISFKKLTALIKDVESKKEDGTYGNSYTTASMNKLDEMLTAAKSITEDADETALKEAYDNLNTAIAGLVKAAATVTLSSDPANSGILSGGGRYAVGDEVQISAKAVSGYTFDGWYLGDVKQEGLGTTFTYTVKEGDEELAYTAKYTANENKNLSIMIGSGKVKIVNNEVSDEFTEDCTKSYSKGSYLTITAVPNEGSTFLYWIDNYTGRILSEKETYRFYLSSDTQLKACYKVTADNSHYVIFKDLNGKILQAGDVADKTAATAPTHGTFTGYTFTGWDKDFSNVTEDMVITAVYEKQTGYTVAVTDGTIQNGKESYTYGDFVTVQAEAQKEEKYFSGWYAGDKLVSDQNEYSFYVTGNVELTTKFEGEDVLKEQPMVNMAMGERSTDSETQKQRVQMIVSWSVPEGCTMLEAGLVRTLVDDQQDNMELSKVDGTNIKKNTSKLTTAEGTYAYTLTLGIASKSKNLYVKGYLSYIDNATGEIRTIYTDKYTSNAITE